MLPAAGVLCAGFLALGVWQIERRAWKHALIARVETRVHAAPVPAPGVERWRFVDEADDGYRRVAVRGRFLNDRSTLVQAVTDRGPGHWVVTPMIEERGFTVLVNQGFVPSGVRAVPPVSGQRKVVGLMRMSEPGGAFLRSNDPARDAWYSRDVTAIGRARALSRVAPYFVDAERTIDVPGRPVGGLTVVAFTDNHLVYAATWFVLAALVAGAGVLVPRQERRR